MARRITTIRYCASRYVRRSPSSSRQQWKSAHLTMSGSRRNGATLIVVRPDRPAARMRSFWRGASPPTTTVRPARRSRPFKSLLPKTIGRRTDARRLRRKDLSHGDTNRVRGVDALHVARGLPRDRLGGGEKTAPWG